MEFYFKKADLLKLINDNENATGIIISQEIVEKTGPRETRASIVYITARPTNNLKAAALGDGEIYGCPYPPGCTEE
ncbi:MAG: hypothetical protein JWQ78_1512 [Sediminibacterium sp.]|nr:hypothetical protein [Sediminibacterium sp.]